MPTNKKRGSKSRYSSSCSAKAASSVLVDTAFFNEIEALAKLYANEAEAMRTTKKVTLVRKLPMLSYEDFEPLNTILVCRNSEERILFLKDMDKQRTIKDTE